MSRKKPADSVSQDPPAKPPGKRPAARRNKTTGAFLVSDALWERIRPLLPERVNTHRFGGGKPPADDRKCLNGIFFVLRTGCQWNALSATGICPSSTAHDRYQQWVAQGVFLRFWQAGLMEHEELKGLDWDWLSMNGAMGKAPLGGEKTGANPTDRGKRGNKRSLLTEGGGIPVGLVIDGANRHDMKLCQATLESIVVPRPAPTGEKPQGLCLDKGYDYPEIRRIVESLGFEPHMRSRGEEKKALGKEEGFKARRWVVERTHSWMNRFRSVLIRWSKKPENHLAMLHFVCGLIAYRAAGLFG